MQMDSCMISPLLFLLLVTFQLEIRFKLVNIFITHSNKQCALFINSDFYFKYSPRSLFEDYFSVSPVDVYFQIKVTHCTQPLFQLFSTATKAFVRQHDSQCERFCWQVNKSISWKVYSPKFSVQLCVWNLRLSFFSLASLLFVLLSLVTKHLHI